MKQSHTKQTSGIVSPDSFVVTEAANAALILVRIISLVIFAYFAKTSLFPG
jgi:hypothetical protein